MGMYIDFYKVVTKEEYDANKYINWMYTYRYYTKNLGNIPKYINVVTCEDMHAAFKNIGLDLNNYDFNQYYGGVNMYSKRNTHLTEEDDFYENYKNEQTKAELIKSKTIVELTDKEVPIYTKTEYVYYVKYVNYQKIRWDIEEDMLRIRESLYVGTMTKSRFEELINYIPKLKYIIYDYYKIPKDLDFDIFYISW